MFSVIYAHSFSTGLGLHRFRFRFSHSSPQGANGRHRTNQAAAKDNVYKLTQVHTTRFYY